MLVQAFADHGSVAAVARVTGISLPTIHRWKRDPRNMDEVEAARRNVHEALSIFQAALPGAAKTLCRVATEGANSKEDSVTANAADKVFERHDALRRSSIFGQRIARLEAKEHKVARGARR